ncbi:CPBP family intramembrane metalloprotease [Pedobacter polaris]|uniref:CPBP family intramembrane metalloprotease n=1 Tax=Pedobacter polaris TaxID=2571273 RepID=A0A4U1CDW3_9SPHI|nr:type II CAAX endopeptidase family protein [Pedobacter polaris]TKC04595.1 CPBP family intramembrane metalloprotease [Pedobacter polaris]
MEKQHIDATFCENCQSEILVNNNFCRVCGQAQNLKEVSFHANKKQNLQQIALFFAIEIIVCISALLIENHTIAISLFFDFVMAITAILFFCNNWSENKFILKWPNFSIKKVVGLVVVTVIVSYIVQFLVGHLNRFIFNEDYSFYFTYAFHKYGNYIMVLSVALLPALFEELAYRGFLMQRLLNIVDEKEAIYITSILFFFIHFSMISFFWMLPFGLLLAYVRIKTNTLWYGVIMHFFFNLTACFVEIYDFSNLGF